MNNKHIYIKDITVTDPDTGGDVIVELWKDVESGGIFGIDESFLDAESGVCFNPFSGDEDILDVDDLDPFIKWETLE